MCTLITCDFIQKETIGRQEDEKNLVQVYININVIKNRHIYYKFGLFYCENEQKNTL